MKYLIATVSFFLGIVLTAGFFALRTSEVGAPEQRDRTDVANDFISPLLDCPSANMPLPAKHVAIENAVRKSIALAKERGDIESASVYFRDLHNGPSFGVDSNVLFSTASLLKVPVMIGYFKQLESNPTLFQETIVYQAQKHELPGVLQNVEPPDRLVEGNAYPVDFLIYRMITLSDNAATAMLLEYKPQVNVVSILQDMGVKLNVTEEDVNLSVSAYASIFRILYNATYLSRAHSRGALELLARSHMVKGLVAGVDGSVNVSHKFGEREFNGVYQFHDCGIVYAQTRPYLLCVMTRGRQKIDPLIKTVADISKAVFIEIKNL